MCHHNEINSFISTSTLPLSSVRLCASQFSKKFLSESQTHSSKAHVSPYPIETVVLPSAHRNVASPTNPTLSGTYKAPVLTKLTKESLKQHIIQQKAQTGTQKYLVTLTPYKFIDMNLLWKNYPKVHRKWTSSSHISVEAPFMLHDIASGLCHPKRLLSK